MLWSLHRQLAGDRLLVPGGSFTLTAWAQDPQPGNVPFALLFAGLPAAAAPTPFGPLRLGAGALAPLGLAVFPASGAPIGLQLGVPANAALLGLRPGFQALIAHGPTQWRLSGLVAETIVQ